MQLFHLLVLLTASLIPFNLSAELSPAEVDQAIIKLQMKVEAQPSHLTNDEEFLRRLSLDVRGVIPSIEEVLEFSRDDSPTKRADWITRMMNDSRYGDHWAMYWDKVLVGVLQQPSDPVRQENVKLFFRKWVAEEFNSNTAYDEFARQIISAEGSYPDDPQVLPLSRWRQAPASMAGTMSRVFLGKDIQCAQCHTHKDEPELTQEKFWEFASFFTATNVVPVPKIEGEQYASIVVRDSGVRWEFRVPDSMMKVSPHYLDGTEAKQKVLNGDGEAMSPRELRQLGKDLREWNQRRNAMRKEGVAPTDMVSAMKSSFPDFHDTRRTQLGEMMTVDDREQLSLNFTNRLWARLFGQGFVEPIDYWISVDAEEIPEPLQLLSEEFIRSGFNVKHIEWVMLNTQAYQRSSVPNDSNLYYPEVFAHSQIRSLSPDQIFNSTLKASRIETQTTDNAPANKVALFNRYQAQFVSTLNNDEMEWVDTFETSIPKALFLLNNNEYNKSIRMSDTGLLGSIMEKTSDPNEMISYLYLATLSRNPTEQERTHLGTELSEVMATNRKETERFMEDVFWALLCSAEFMTNH